MFSSALLRLWRSGAHFHFANASEEDESEVSVHHKSSLNVIMHDFAPQEYISGYICVASSMQLAQQLQSLRSHNEYALHINCDVSLWLDSRAYHKKPPLHTAFGFVVVTPELHDEFDAFKEKLTTPTFPRVALLDFWNRNVRPTPATPITMNGKQYFSLQATEVDNLCQWVYNTRKACQDGMKIEECKRSQHVSIACMQNYYIIAQVAHSCGSPSCNRIIGVSSNQCTCHHACGERPCTKLPFHAG